ncbi:MAG: hypothetical protein ABW022_17150 [Actinoplanes sp.]
MNRQLSSRLQHLVLLGERLACAEGSLSSELALCGLILQRRRD